MSFDSNNTLTYTFFSTFVYNCHQWTRYSYTYFFAVRVLVLISMVNFSLELRESKYFCRMFDAELKIICIQFRIFFSWSAKDVIIWVSILFYSSPCIVMAVVSDKMAAIFQTNFEMHFLEWKITNFDLKMSLKCVHKGLISYIPALIQIMARHRPGDNDGWFTDAYMQHSVSMI